MKRYLRGYRSGQTWLCVATGVTGKEADANLKLRIIEQALETMVRVNDSLIRDGLQPMTAEQKRVCFQRAVDSVKHNCEYIGETYEDEA